MVSFKIMPQMCSSFVSKAWCDTSCVSEGQGTDVPRDCPCAPWVKMGSGGSGGSLAATETLTGMLLTCSGRKTSWKSNKHKILTSVNNKHKILTPSK